MKANLATFGLVLETVIREEMLLIALVQSVLKFEAFLG